MNNVEERNFKTCKKQNLLKKKRKNHKQVTRTKISKTSHKTSNQRLKKQNRTSHKINNQRLKKKKSHKNSYRKKTNAVQNRRLVKKPTPQWSAEFAMNNLTLGTKLCSISRQLDMLKLDLSVIINELLNYTIHFLS